MISEIRDELRAVARSLLAKTGPDWRMFAESGWLGLEVPAELDGAGATFAETAVVLEELGRAAAAGAFLGAIVLGAGTLALLEPSPGRDDLLRRTASGSLVMAAALTDAGGTLASAAGALPPFRLERSTDGGPWLTGRAAFVPDAAEADCLLLLAADTDGTLVVAHVDPAAPGLSRTPQPVLDQTRRLGLVAADAAEVASVWRFAGDPADAVRGLLDRAAVAVACDSLGLSEAMLDATVSYARVRHQFGRPIGSFQAVKHACADMLVQIRVARHLVADAVRQLCDDDADASVAASMAKAYACGMAVEVAGKAMQLHGGMGYTWESGIHVYLKRAALNRSLFGSPAEHRARLALRYR